jgi:hypothetical protein
MPFRLTLMIMGRERQLSDHILEDRHWLEWPVDKGIKEPREQSS